MLFWLGLITGLIIGWLIEWLIDWGFWRRSLNISLDEERRWRTQLDTAQREIQKLQAQLADSIPSDSAVAQQDRLEEIQGINDAFAQQLHAAGIHTFAQLAELAPEQLTQLIHPAPQQSMNPVAWIAQARQLAQRKEGD